MTARAAAALSPVRGPGSLRRLGSRWHRPWGSGRASSRASSPAERQPGPPPGPQPSLCGTGLLRGGAKGSLCLALLPSSAAPSPARPFGGASFPSLLPSPSPPVILTITTIPALEGSLTRDRARGDRGGGEGKRGEEGSAGPHCEAQQQKLSTLESLLLLHGQSPSQPSCSQTVSSKYVAGTPAPRLELGKPGSGSIPCPPRSLGAREH